MSGSWLFTRKIRTTNFKLLRFHTKPPCTESTEAIVNVARYD